MSFEPCFSVTRAITGDLTRIYRTLIRKTYTGRLANGFPKPRPEL